MDALISFFICLKPLERLKESKFSVGCDDAAHIWALAPSPEAAAAAATKSLGEQIECRPGIAPVRDRLRTIDCDRPFVRTLNDAVQLLGTINLNAAVIIERDGGVVGFYLDLQENNVRRPVLLQRSTVSELFEGKHEQFEFEADAIRREIQHHF
jgi:hypothetical protein